MLYRLFLGACGAILALGLVRLLRPVFAGERRGRLADLLALVLLIPVALGAVAPYLGASLVGAGDSRFYALQVADFVTQARQGVAPVFVGQSGYGFNGNINSVRTAPYLTHLAGLLDLGTGRRLPFVALLNLTVVASAVLAAWFAYGVACAASGGRRLAAWLLAVVYVTSAACLSPLLGSDMFATFMTAPWLVVGWHGLARLLQGTEDRAPQVLTAIAAAMLAYAHAPIAGWFCLAWGLAQAWRVCANGATPAQWRHQAAAGLIFAALAAYLLVSVSALGTRSLGEPDLSAFTFRYSLASLRDALRGEFQPYLLHPDEAGIQLGATLWVLFLAVAFVTLRRRRPGALLLLGLITLLLAYLIPLPPLAGPLWRLLPDRLLAMTPWPAQRLCPVIGAGILVAAAGMLREMSPAAGRGICGLLIAGLAYNAAELHALQHRAGLARLAPAAAGASLLPDNAELTRYAYALFDEPPDYFTNGWADPEFETRVLGPDREIAQDNAGAVRAGTPAVPPVTIAGAAGLDLAGAGEYLLDFEFTDHDSAGELTLQAGAIVRRYALPRSGGPLAFGSAPGCARAIPLRVPAGGIHLTVASTVPGVSLRARPVDRSTLPVRLEGLMPFTAAVRAAAGGYLETPRVFIAGYQATVNGARAEVRSSPNGLVMVPIPAGESRVVVSYPGPVALRLAWLLSLGALAACPWLLARTGAFARDEAAAPGLSRAWIREHNVFAGMARAWRSGPGFRRAAVGAVLVAGAAWLGAQAWHAARDYGPCRLTIELTRRTHGRAEPLLTLGRPGAADCVYLVPEGPHAVRFGLDHWGHAGVLSDPVPITYGEPHVVEIDLGGLYPVTLWPGHRGPPATGPAGTAPFSIRLDGQPVLQTTSPYYPAGPAETYVGRNPTGGSVTRGNFSGLIHRVERRPRPAAR
ncbi:MAG TPA: hypothetical protein VHD61_08820 [Lacunisphaera sp.]|nr:hypothetical protein [Lacunisphaera sp.]